MATEAATATGPQYVTVINSGKGTLQYPDPNGLTLIYTAQLAGNTVVVTVNGQTSQIQPGTYQYAPDPNSFNVQWLVQNGSIKLAVIFN
jgi:glyoxylate utilization-related uncharacterized protein